MISHISVRILIHRVIQRRLIVHNARLLSRLIKLFINLQFFLFNRVATRHRVIMVLNVWRIHLVFNLKIQHLKVRTLFIENSFNQFRRCFLRLGLVAASQLLQGLTVYPFVVYDSVFSKFYMWKISKINRLFLNLLVLELNLVFYSLHGNILLQKLLFKDLITHFIVF